MLGTNDAKSEASDVRAYFASDLRALLERLFAMRRRATRPGACAWLLLPPLVHGGGGSAPVYGIQPDTVRALAPRVRAAAAALGIGVIDTRAPLEKDWRAAFGRGRGNLAADLAGDGVHPPPHGMATIAHAVWQKLSAHRAPGQLPHKKLSNRKPHGRRAVGAEQRRGGSPTAELAPSILAKLQGQHGVRTINTPKFEPVR